MRTRTATSTAPISTPHVSAFRSEAAPDVPVTKVACDPSIPPDKMPFSWDETAGS